MDRHGIVAEASLAPAVLVHKLQRATFSGVTVSVPKARWVWPRTLDGAQSGDEVLVYADLPEGERLFVELSRPTRTRRMVPVREAERSLLERAWVGARIQKLLHERDTFAAKDPDLREAMRRQVIALSTQHRVLSDFTGLLVLETEADYARFHLERRALSDILTVGAAGLEKLGFQVITDELFHLLASLLGLTPDPARCQVATTVSAVGTEPYGGSGLGVPDATVTIEPALPPEAGPIYFRYISPSIITPDPSLTLTTIDGGVLFLNVPAGEYILSAHKEGTTFTSVKLTCRPGLLVNAAPPWGIQQR